MKEFHIITGGNSLVEHFKREKGDEYPEIKEIKMGDPLWKRFLDDPQFLERVYEFLAENPKAHSAELNCFFRYCEERSINPQDCEVYLAGTKTPSNEIARQTITRYLTKNRITNVLTSLELPGYFGEEFAIRAHEFTRGLSEMLDRFIYIARKKKMEGYRVVFSPTGGFKPHVIVCGLAGFLTGSEVYYIHEEFKETIVFPPLFYLPRRREIDVLRELSDKIPRSGKDWEEFQNKYSEEVERLEYYGLVDVEEDRFGKRYRIKITNMGIWAFEYLKEKF